MRKKKETIRQGYIRILRMDCEIRDDILAADLIEKKYMKGVIRTNELGLVNGAKTAGPTMEGRLLLSKLEKEESEESVIGRIKWWLIFVAGVGGGLLLDIIRQILLKYIENQGA